MDTVTPADPWNDMKKNAIYFISWLHYDERMCDEYQHKSEIHINAYVHLRGRAGYWAAHFCIQKAS